MSLYQKTRHIEYVYKGALEYLTENGSLGDLVIPYFDLSCKRWDDFNPEENFTLNSCSKI